jgi:hypothetical protein
MIIKVFLRKKILGDILVEYLGNISGKNLRGSLGKYLGSISVGTMLRRRRSCRKKQLRLKLSVRDAEGCRS